MKLNDGILSSLSKGQRTLLITCSSGLVVFVFLGGLIFLAGLGFSLLFGEPTLAVTVTDSLPVAAGGPFDLAITVSNIGDRAVPVSEIRLPMQLFEGSELLGSEPAAGPGTNYSGRIGYPFDISLSPGESRTFTFHFKSHYPGDYFGTLEVLSGRRAKAAPLNLRIDAPLPTPTPAGAAGYPVAVLAPSLLN
jgi:hypothetical protein